MEWGEFWHKNVSFIIKYFHTLIILFWEILSKHNILFFSQVEFYQKKRWDDLSVSRCLPRHFVYTTKVSSTPNFNLQIIWEAFLHVHSNLGKWIHQGETYLPTNTSLCMIQITFFSCASSFEFLYSSCLLSQTPTLYIFEVLLH